ncbi:hypothetical protein RN001_014126 [Aquatica leii]|uniref:Uncharacterized protein n=1 Tax=Aquatica leii TaxID=1421715 RepID=A0AAN7P3S9_9COLE|nr:hypothetical protein RN001_014126 [Aquatica leii]
MVENSNKSDFAINIIGVKSATQRGVTEHDIETSVTTSEKCAPSTSGCIVNHEALPNETAAISAQSESWEIEMENSEEIDSLQGEDTGDSTATQAKDEYADKSISDIGAWPILIPDNLRTLLVARGYKTVQHLDSPRRIRKTKKMTGEEAADAGFSYDIKLRQEMYESVDRITQEIKTRFHQLHELDVKYSFLTPTNLLNLEYKCEFNEEPSDVDMKEFEIERER